MAQNAIFSTKSEMYLLSLVLVKSFYERIPKQFRLLFHLYFSDPSDYSVARFRLGD